jgi:hypothetical protein
MEPPYHLTRDFCHVQAHSAAKGIKAGAKLAKALGAKATAVYVVPRYAPPSTATSAPWQGIPRVLAHSKIPVLVVR